jgi:hypothetical protein
MSKAIQSYPEGERSSVIARRLKSDTGGLGFLSAQAALKQMRVAHKRAGGSSSNDQAIRAKLIEKGLIKPVIEADQPVYDEPRTDHSDGVFAGMYPDDTPEPL